MPSNITIIAELGINFDGDSEKKYDLIDIANECSADKAKFQLYSVDSLFPDKQIIVNNKNYYDIVKECELTFEQAKDLFEYGQTIGIEVFFSVFDTERVRWCEEIGVSRYKIGARGIDNTELSDAIRGTNKEAIVSIPYGKASFNQATMWSPAKWLYCIPEYPTPEKSLKLGKVDFKKIDGLSEHSPSIIPSIIAVSKGATIIEKHLTWSRKYGEGPDHSSSLEPNEFKKMVLKIREIEECL